MHGLGNDFIVIDAINQDFKPEPERIRAWAQRNTGIGFDQLLVVEAAETEQAAFKYRIFNADGDLIPVTVIKVDPCKVVNIRSAKKHGYEAVRSRKINF